MDAAGVGGGAEPQAGDRLFELRRTIANSRGLRRAGIAAGAGVLSVLAFAPFFLWPVLFLTLPVLVWLTDGAGDKPGAQNAVRAAALAGWWFGFGFFFAGLFWIGEAFLVEADKFGWALPFAVTLMPAGLALFWGLACAVARFVCSQGLARVLVLALTLTSAELARGTILTGFPWNVLGYSLTAPDVMMQSAGLLGIYGLTLWAVLIFAAPLVCLADEVPGQARRRAGFAGLAIAVVPLATLYAYGLVRLAAPPQDKVEGVRLRIVQPSVRQREKWLPENQGRIFRDHLDLSGRNESGVEDGMAGITHVVWPEAAMPFLPLEHPEALSAIGEALPQGVTLISGALRREGNAEPGHLPRAFNSLMAFDDTGALAALYDKTHLVPFGEYLPLKGLLERIGLRQLTQVRAGFEEGPLPRPIFRVPRLPPAGGLICYEAIFPGLVANSLGRPDVLVNVTNDGWFGNTTGPRQHFHQARVRAVEQGVPLVRAANNGISALIDGRGRVLARLSLNVRGVIDVNLPKTDLVPLHALYGEWILGLNSFLFGLTAIELQRRRRKRGRSAVTNSP